MASVELTTQQVIELVRQLPPADKQEVLMAVASESQASMAELRETAGRELRRTASQRGLDWERMSDEQRQVFVDDLIHEDRRCRE
jgi:hypothetical protein